jgi:hypothetical protein
VARLAGRRRDIEKLEAEERRLQLKAKCQRALILARLFGGGALILGTKTRSFAADSTESVKAAGSPTST